jgi:polyferredoxin
MEAAFSALKTGLKNLNTTNKKNTPQAENLVMNKQKFIQILRFAIQAFFLIGLILAFGPHYNSLGKKIFLTILVVGVFFCGWLCPFGTVQDWAAGSARFLHLPHWQLPKKYQRYAQVSRYVFYALGTIGISFVALNARGSFNHRLFEGGLTTLAAWILGGFVVIALFIDRPFCNYFCTKGAFYGMLSVVRWFAPKRDNSRCVHCKLCSLKCPMNIDVEQTDFVRHPNCINCLRCYSVCPKNCIHFGAQSSKQK